MMATVNCMNNECDHLEHVYSYSQIDHYKTSHGMLVCPKCQHLCYMHYHSSRPTNGNQQEQADDRRIG